MFVGSNLNMDIRKAAPTESRFITSISAGSVPRVCGTGTFPDKTVLVMEVIGAGTNASINRKGQFEDKPLGIEVALKDEKRSRRSGRTSTSSERRRCVAQAKAFAKEACWNATTSSRGRQRVRAVLPRIARGEAETLNLAEFDYELPEELIGPASPGSARRLAHAGPLSDEQRWEDRRFVEFPSFLRPGDCLVLNNSKLIHRGYTAIAQARDSAADGQDIRNRADAS